MVFWEFWDPSLGDFLILKGPGQKQNFSLTLHSHWIPSGSAHLVKRRGKATEA